MGVVLEGSNIVHLGGTRMWIVSTCFAFSGESSDAQVLQELIAADGYGHDFAAPFSGHNTAGAVPVHGRWRLACITAEQFEPTTVDDAARTIRSWSTDQDWYDPEYRHAPEVLEQIEGVIDGLDAGSLHRLRHPGPESEHDYAATVGGTGFHEYVVIDRGQGRVTVVVASDD
ncbi:hypothetical protein DEJ28_15510 [Curtobacterium sp. MCPF17_002]|uniref:hypothetical protein n=1 Tax=Curtobacterium sp. MCPF17_002 TaxID=2175645 RepID=UPI000DA8E102|nr:hypothetical protein [Curtobacterium sp. MCPF17_002]WIB77041.1 hypothetical protein DEJ28_15510 [Curtobacterium sp. MCPF17_002]